MLDPEEIRRKQIFFYGLNIFWQEISENLPKSLERLALGDETIFYAIQRAYMKFIPTILESERIRIAKEVENLVVYRTMVSKEEVLSIIKQYNEADDMVEVVEEYHKGELVKITANGVEMPIKP